MSYLVATLKEWNLDQYERYSKTLKGEWHLITDKSELTLEKIYDINPEYIFFPHWSWIVPREVVEKYNCVCFHMTDLPYGRGGSPLQNLIARGYETTKISALRMSEDVDSGDIYLKRDLDLSGSAQEIFVRASSIIANMIEFIVKTNPKPAPQVGEIVKFERRTPEQSEVPSGLNVQEVYNHIRMLDAEGYPKAFAKFQGMHLTFSDAKIIGNRLLASVEIEIENE